MSDLVGAVKTYAYMDRGELVEVDVHEGLETTLAVLGHKLKHTAIEVVRDYDRSLPKLTVRGSELNQVWTNLLDNAIDALGEQRHDHDRARAATATARWSRSPTTARGSPPETATACSTPSSPPRTSASGTGLGPRHRAADRRRPPRRVADRRLRARPDGVLTSRFRRSEPRRTTLMATCTHLDQVEVPELPDAGRRLRGVPGRRRRLGAPADLPECGKVGCCDTSPNRHASRHADEAGHPIMRSHRARRGLVVVRRRRARVRPGGVGVAAIAGVKRSR